MKQSNKQPYYQDQALMELYDNLTTFNERCAFLCDAIPGLLSRDYEPDEQTIAGTHRYLMDLRTQAQALQIELEAIREQLPKNP